jgi:hypothetical protein
MQLKTANRRLRPWSHSYVSTDGQSVSWSCVKPHPGLRTRFLWLSHGCGFVDVGRPIWREEGSVASAVILGSESRETHDHILLFQAGDFWRARSPCLYPQRQGGSVIPSGIVFPFRRLLRLAGLRWRYLNPPSKVKIKVTLRLVVYRQSVRLDAKPLETHDQSFFLSWTLALIVLM